MVRFKHLTVHNAILCDDVRGERNNNKNILIGVYSGDIVISELPALVGLAFYLDGEVNTLEPVTMELRLSGPGKGKAVQELTLDPGTTSKSLSLASPQMHVNFECEGQFKIALRDPGGPWKAVISKSVILNPAIATSFRQPPEQSPSGAQDSSSAPAPSRPRSRKKK